MKATENKKTKEHSRKKKETGKLSEQELRELMGVNRPRYQRKRGGAFVQR